MRKRNKLRDRIAKRVWAKKYPLYGTWNQMKQRCYNKRHEKYPVYGARGITVCKRWRDSYTLFAKDMGKRPTPQHSIDRKNTNGNYEPRNCRWATRSEQRMNYRDSIHITWKGTTMPLKLWAEKIGVAYKTLWARHSRGYQLKRLMNPTLEKISCR